MPRVYKYKPSPWQAKAHKADAKMKWLWVGRRGGKGRWSLQEALAKADEASRTPCIVDGEKATALEAGLTPAIHIWVVAPNYSQATQIWNEMKEFIPPHMVRGYKPGQAGGRGRTGWNGDRLNVWLDFKDEKGKWLPGRWRPSVFWEIKSADNWELLQTVGLDFLWLTESQDIREEAWNKVSPVLNSPYRLGRACIEGIPPISRGHWFSKRFNFAKKNPSKLNLSIEATSFDNVYLDDEQRESIHAEREVMTEATWLRMYMAQQPEGGGGFFRKVQEAARGRELAQPRRGRRYVAGLDLGRINDPTVLIIKDAQSRESVAYVEMLKRDWQLQREAIVAEAKKWRVGEVRMDSTGMGGDIMFEDLSILGVPVNGYKFTTISKKNLFDTYALALEKETVSFPPEWNKLEEQLENLDVSNIGMGFKFSQIDSGHDDWLDAESLALMACDPPNEYSGGDEMTWSIAGLIPIGNAQRSQNGILALSQQREERKKIRALEEEFPDLFVNGQPKVL